MADLDLRPLSLGEILDRTFSLYRSHFPLFVGITAIPQLLILALNLFNTMSGSSRAPVTGGLKASPSGGLIALGVTGVLTIVFAYIAVYIFVQGGTVFAISELYLGRTTTIGASLGRMRGHFWSLVGVSILSGLSILAATLLLIIPGIWVACRLITSVPTALLEDRSPSDSLRRSFELTKGEAGRSFIIYLLYFVLIMVSISIFEFPFGFAAGLSARNHDWARVWLGLGQVGNFLATVLVTPILTIATAIFYYDLRVRKEAFDLQLMMNPGGAPPAGPLEVPGTLS
jgi:hypothetical protein